MHIRSFLILFFGLIAAVGAVTAADQSVIGSSSEWLVANGADQSTITVQVQNSSLARMPGVIVQFSVDNPAFGTFTRTSSTTDGSGLASTIFIANKKSGDATITATFTYNDSVSENSVQKTCTQKIDHDIPYTAVFDYTTEVIVGTETPFKVSFKDRWGNVIDTKKPDNPHTINLHIGSVQGGAAFNDGGLYVKDITKTPDVQGMVSVNVKVDTVAGENIVWMKSFDAIPDQYRSITGITEGIPFSIDQFVQPDNPASLPADMAADHKFTFVYTLRDKYGNVAANRSVFVQTSAGGEDQTLVTNNYGQVWLNYGPRSIAGFITITATAVDNSSVTCNRQVEFYNTAPVNMLVTANPETMASLDVDPTIRADIRAKVMDVKGNPVTGETVTFSLGTPTYDDPAYVRTAEPELVTTTATTNNDGFAVVQFKPGGFTLDKRDPLYSSQATGHCIVTANWNGVLQTVQLTWKNYPYLSVQTSVNPSTVAVNDTVDVTIRLKGDGWALQPDPIDVILCTDRSGSMMKDNPDRMVSIMGAEKVFVGQLSFPRDHIGEVSFGQQGLARAQSYNEMGPGIDSQTSDDASYISAYYPGNPTESTGTHTYSDYATLDLPLSDSESTIMSTIDTMIPYSGTPLRQGLYVSINEMKAHSTRSEAVKAIVVLSDGDYNYYGDPLARGSGSTALPNNNNYFYDLTKYYYSYSGLGSGKLSNQNMSVYAASNNIKIYSIAYGNTITSGGQTTLKILAEGSGGKYYFASATDIADVYRQIAGDLKEEAGVNTTMTLNFHDVNVTGVTVPGAQVYEYIYTPGISTFIQWQDGTANTTDQRNDWNDDQKLNFTIGTIKLNQVWQSTFRLKIKQAGNIDVFGTGSTISFNGGESTLTLPHTFITAVSDLHNIGLTMKAIDVSRLEATQSGTVKDFIPLQWNITYPGTLGATERVFYSNDNRQTWVQFHTITGIPAGAVDRVEHASFDTRDKPPGEYYIRVLAQAPDALGDEEIISAPVTVGNSSKVYIKLE